MELILAFNKAGAEVDREKFFSDIMRGNPTYARSTDLLDYDQCRELMEEFAQSNRTLCEAYYRNATAPLFSELAPLAPVEFWLPGQPEYFDMLLRVMTAVVDAVGGRAPPADEKKKRKKMKLRKGGGMGADA